MGKIKEPLTNTSQIDPVQYFKGPKQLFNYHLSWCLLIIISKYQELNACNFYSSKAVVIYRNGLLSIRGVLPFDKWDLCFSKHFEILILNHTNFASVLSYPRDQISDFTHEIEFE